jgi:hypothetical protein
MTAPSDMQVLIPEFQLSQDVKRKRRIVVAIDGRERQGKTHFCLTAPGPIVYLDFDMGGEGVVEKAQAKGKTIIRTAPFVARPPETTSEDVQELSVIEWERFKKSYDAFLTKPALMVGKEKVKARTIIIDTGTEMYELLRLAWFGKLVQVPTFKYRETNAVMRDIVRSALESDVNVILTHKMKAEWKKGAGDEKQSKSGAYERAGFEEMGHLVQANLFAYRAPLPGAASAKWKFKVGTGEAHEWVADARSEKDDLGFRVRFLDSRHDPTLEGIELQNDTATFTDVARMIHPDTTEKDWEDVA